MDFFRILIFLVAMVGILGGLAFFIIYQYQKILRASKNYERGLKMVVMHIHLPPSSTDIEVGSRDERDVTEEVLSQAQVMYNIIASTAEKGWLRSYLYGQRHCSFEIVADNGLVYYYAAVPVSMVDIVRQAIITAYPSARVEESRGNNIFSQRGQMSGLVGGEFSLKKDFVYPIQTYQDSHQDAARSLLNALSSAKDGDGVAIQLLLRPAGEQWTSRSVSHSTQIKTDKASGKSASNPFGSLKPQELLEMLWKAPQAGEETGRSEERQLNSLDQAKIQAIENKTQFPGFETLIRVVVSSNTAAQSQVLLQNVIASFALFDSPTLNGFKFDYSTNVDELATAYIMRFFPQEIKSNVLNSVELATVFHLPSQKDIPSSKVERQMLKQVDGPTAMVDEGLLLGYNEFRGIKKPIRLSTNDRRRHTYFIGQTGTGKSGLLENLAYQDMLDGRGFAFIDPHGDVVEKLLGMVPRERVEDVIYFNPSDVENPIGLNLFEFETEDQKDFLIQEAIQMLYRLYDPGHTGIIGPRFEQWFRNAALTLMSDPNGSSFIDVPQVFTDQAFADYKLQFVKDQTVLDFWNKEMAQTTESSKSDMLGWFASKFGAFLSNEMMRNIIGQTKSGFNIREIMDNKKILLVNLSKGTTGELNSMLIGMIFIMKFQAAAMSRADMAEGKREDFCLYVDEFQNFATESFESILSEARKYRLNLILANQFMTQLTDKIREAIIGNVGTLISGRIGITDAEILYKRFSPTFDAEDLTRLPNFQTITSVMIQNVPSSPFSMTLIPPMGSDNPRLREAVKKLSASKFGMSREDVSKDIFARLSKGDEMKKRQAAKQPPLGAAKPPLPAGAKPASAAPTVNQPSNNFLDDWLARRQELNPSAGQAANSVAAPQVKASADAVVKQDLSYKAAQAEAIEDKGVSQEMRVNNYNAQVALNKKQTVMPQAAPEPSSAPTQPQTPAPTQVAPAAPQTPSQPIPAATTVAPADKDMIDLRSRKPTDADDGEVVIKFR